VTFTIGVPQIILLVILAYDFVEAVAKDGQPQERPYSGGHTAVGDHRRSSASLVGRLLRRTRVSGHTVSGHIFTHSSGAAHA
jgi:hypothetical protein